MRIGATLAGIVGGTKLQTARDLGIEVSPEGSITDEVIELHVAVLHRTQVSPPMVELGLVSRVTPVHTAMRNSTRDEGGPFEVDNQVLISSHRKLLWSKAMVVSVAEKPKQDSGRHG